MKLLFVNFLLVFNLLGSVVGGADPFVRTAIEFRNPSAENQYPQGIVFRIETCGRPAPMRMVFNYLSSGFLYEQQDTQTVFEGKTSDGCDRWKYFLDGRAHLVPPFSPVTYSWSVTEGTKVVSRSSNYVCYYKDMTYKWQKIEKEGLVIWWHDRPDQFGRNVMYVAARAYADQAKFYSLSLKSPITIVIANTDQEFFAWQPEESYAGGMTFADVFLTMQVVEDRPDYYEWVGEVIPHEISHIYLDHLVKRYSGTCKWFEEGMSSYNEYSGHLSDWETLKTAAAGKLPALKDLRAEFGEDEEQVALAYAESYYAILYMDEFYGRQAIATLLYEYSKGTGETAAFQKAFGKTPEQFESDFTAWLPERLKTRPPNTVIPSPTQSSIAATPAAGGSSSSAPSYPAIAAAALLIVLFTGIVLRAGQRKRRTRI